MRHSGVVLLVVIQLGAFFGTLGLGKAGIVSGELAALAALVVWFAVGLPLSFAPVDIIMRWQIKPAREDRSMPAIQPHRSTMA